MEKNNIRYGKLTEYFSVKTRQDKIPFSGVFELTPRCNMNCKMCYIRMSDQELERVGRELPVEEWIRIAQEAVNDGMVMLLLTGGEALLYKDFKKFYLAVHQMGLFISINTNGTTLTDSWIEFFKQYPPAKFNITIYGGSNETYQRLCGNPKGFDQMKANVEKLLANHFEVFLNYTISRQNVEDMEAVYAFGSEHDLKIHATTYCFPPVRKEGVVDPALDRFTPQEAAKARVRMNWNSFHDKIAFLTYAMKTLLNIPSKPDEPSCEPVGQGVRCAAGRSNFWVTWDGRMLPCGMLPNASVSAVARPFSEAWKETVANTEQITLAPECTNCTKKNVCVPCAAKLSAESGAYSRKSEYNCQYVEEYLRLLKEAVTVLRNEEKDC